MIDFLLGALFGFIDDEYIACPHCGCEFLEEEMPDDDGKYVCPACLRPLEGSDDDEGDDEEQDLE
jgi:uncharacterized Zn finger protein (UPF0148 family)